MTKIIVKEVDRFYSRKKNKNYISEYLIYVSINNNNVACTQVFGEQDKTLIIHEYLISYFDHLLNFNEINSFIEEITHYK